MMGLYKQGTNQMKPIAVLILCTILFAACTIAPITDIPSAPTATTIQESPATALPPPTPDPAADPQAASFEAWSP